MNSYNLFILTMHGTQKIIIHKPHRILMRTEFSIQKMMNQNPSQHIRKVKKLLNQQLRQALNNPKETINSELTRTIIQQPSNTKRRNRHKSNSSLSMFKNARETSLSESYLRPKKNRKTIQKQSLVQRVIQQNGSQKRLLASQKFYYNSGDIDNKFKTLDQKDCESTIEKEQPSHFWKLTSNKYGESQPIDKQEKQKCKSYRHKRLYSQSSQVKLQTELSVQTVKKGDDSDQRQQNVVILNAVKLETSQKPSQQSQQNLNNYALSPEKRQKNEKTQSKKPIIKSTGEENKKMINQSGRFTTIQTQQTNFNRNKRQQQKNYYLQASSIDEMDLEQVHFKKEQKNNRFNNNLKSSILDNPYLPNQSEKKDTLGQHLIKEQNRQQQQEKNKKSTQKKQIKIKQTPQTKQLKSNTDTKFDLTTTKKNNQDVSQKYSLKTEKIEKKEFNDQNKEIKTLNLNAQQLPKNLPQKSLVSMKNADSSRIKQKMQKINILKGQLEMLTQMATFFSQNSKIFKEGTNSQPFLRVKKGLKWHKLVFLCFKFAYFNIRLYEAFFLWGTNFVSVNQNNLRQFQSQNQIWSNTLFKIQKSVRKNMQIGSSDEWISTTFPNINDSQIDLIMEQLILAKKGSSECYKYISMLANQIFDESAILIKSVFIVKILQENSQTSISFKSGMMRIINCCIILEGYLRDRPELRLQPCINIQQLKNPSVQQFKDSYNTLTHQIFSQ